LLVGSAAKLKNGSAVNTAIAVLLSVIFGSLVDKINKRPGRKRE